MVLIEFLSKTMAGNKKGVKNGFLDVEKKYPMKSLRAAGSGRVPSARLERPHAGSLCPAGAGRR